jgi:hypothetical protein
MPQPKADILVLSTKSSLMVTNVQFNPFPWFRRACIMSEIADDRIPENFHFLHEACPIGACFRQSYEPPQPSGPPIYFRPLLQAILLIKVTFFFTYRTQ